MDAFGEEFSGVVEVDPAADFLAREHDQLAGLEAEILPEVESHPVQQGIHILSLICYTYTPSCK